MLPIIKATVRVYNPAYDRRIPNVPFMYDQVREVEVLQLNLNSGGMRVRFMDRFAGKDKVVTQDIPIKEFFEQYSITEK